MIEKAWSWFTERWPFYPLKHLLLDEEIKGGARYAYTLGSAVLIVFTLQAVSGIVMLFYYVPAVDHAYDSVSYLRVHVPFGWLVHNIHYWGANAMVLLIALHMIRVFVWAAYKTQLTWLIGVFLILTTMALSLTGGTLIWDQKGYWGGEVSSGVTSTVPLLGDLMKTLLRGGESMGPLALSRFFVLHVAVLSPVIVLLIGMHMVSFRTTGIVGPWVAEKRKRSGPFWPDQAYKDLIAGTFVIFILITLSVFAPAPFTGPADPSNITYIPKPEWNFLFLYESLKYFEGPLEPVGTVGVPNVLIGLLVLLPFIDRNPERNPFRRPVAMTCLVLYAGFLLVFTVKGYLSPGFAEVPASARQAVHIAQADAKSADSKPAKVPVGRSEAPQPVQSKTTAIPEPSSGAGGAAFMIGSSENGAELFRQQCSSCHGPEGKGTLPNPGSAEGIVPVLNPVDRELFDPDALAFAKKIDRYIQHGSAPTGPAPAIVMPSFGDSSSLTPQQIANIEAYVLGLNGVDRAQLINPGMRPRSFFILVLIVYVVVILVQGGIRFKKDIP